MKTQSRIDRDQLFLDVAALFGLRSTCPRAQVGAVAVQRGRIIATGYNGAPAGMPHCTEVGCELVKHIDIRVPMPKHEAELHCIRAVHAESNLIAWAAREGLALEGSDIYLTHTPCYTCSKLLINCGVKSVHFGSEYGHVSGVDLLKDAKVLIFFHG